MSNRSGGREIIYHSTIVGLLHVSLIFVLSVVYAFASEPIQPLPATVEVNASKVEIGKQLFFDKRLSIDGSLSCASCHDVGAWGAENSDVSTGVNAQLGTRNSPTVYNTTFNFKQFWDGRADSLSHQALGPVVDPIEMGMQSWDDVVDVLSEDKYYQEAFSKVYGAALSKETIVDAIAEYEKTLITPNSPFDRYLAGDANAIDETQKKGYELFKSYGCVACHQGVNVGGNMFQKFGVLEDISIHEGSLSQDLGRYNVTKNEWDKRVFKVPSLRLATKTPPYFHNGSVQTIQDAVDIMIRFQLGRGVPAEDRDSIIAFLESLVGEKPQGVTLQ